MALSDILAKITSAAGGDIFTGVSNIIKDFKLDPAVAQQAETQLAQLKASHEEAMTKLTDDLQAQYLQDTNSARNREAQIATSTAAPLINKITLPVIAMFVTLGFFGLLGYMLKWDVPAGNKDVLNIMLGSLGTAWISIVGYYFGSSMGSKDKDDTIQQLSQN